MNGICRKFPESIVELLKGDGTAGDNTLCTTLFCISSALKKLSQTTPLPETRSAALARPASSRQHPQMPRANLPWPPQGALFHPKTTFVLKI